MPDRRDPHAARAVIWRALLFLLAALLLGWRFYRLRHVEFFDESVETTTGWLLSEGERIYGTIFSHHMPLAAMLSQLVAWISPTDHAAHFRVIPWLAYVLAAWAVFRSPFERDQPGWGAIAALCFLFLTALVAPLVWGQMVLNDGLWGIAFTVLFVRFLLPLVLGMELTSADAVIGGIALVLAGAGSLISFFPILLSGVLILVTLSSKHGRKTAVPWRAFVLAGAGTSIGFLLWLLSFGSLPGFVGEAIRFNFDVYSTYLPEQSGVPMLVKSTLAAWPRDLATAARVLPRLIGEALFAPVFVVCAGYLAFLMGRRFRREGRGGLVSMASIVLVVLIVLFLRMRSEGGFRSLPLYIFLCAAASLLLGQLWAAKRSFVFGLVGAALVGPFLVAATRHDSWRWNVASRREAIGVWARVADRIRTRTSPDERIAAFPTTPLVYLDSKRHPAVDSVYYLPWQAKWESETNRHPNTCERFAAARPRFVVILPTAIWDQYPWADYAACIDKLVKRDYVRIDPDRFDGFLWERIDR